MGFRFFKRVKLAPGVTLNLGKAGGSLSLGPRGAKLTMGTSGKRMTVGVPGTGLFYTVKLGGSSSKGSATQGVSPSAKTASQEAPKELTGEQAERPSGEASVSPTVPTDDRLTLGFFKRLTIPDDEEALVDGFRELVQGNEDAALEHLRTALHLADGAFLSGIIALKKGRLDEASGFLSIAARQDRELGRYFTKYGVAALLSIDITDEVSAHVGPDLKGVLLALIETFQRQKRWQEAIECFHRLGQLLPDDIVSQLSLAELKMEAWPDDRQVHQEVSKMGEGLTNESPLHAALMLYRARALLGLGLKDAALGVITEALKVTKDRPPELLRALRYQRAKIYELKGDAKRARTEFERLYAEDSSYEDVAARLGMK